MAESRRRFPPLSVVAAGIILALAYSVIVAVAIRTHEPWADEAQSWLIARDANLLEIWTKLVRLEGSPGLWHSLLHVLISLGVPYSGLNYVSGFLGLSAALVLFFCSPFPLVIRTLLPFTYFLCFQYAVVARNYSLAPVLLFSAAAAYRARRNGWLLVLLILLALASAQAFLLSVAFASAIGFLRLRTGPALCAAGRKNTTIAIVTYVAALMLIALAVWPNGHTVFFISPNWSLANFVRVGRYAFGQAFGDGYWPVVLIALSIPALWRGPGLLFFALSSLSLVTFGAVVYSNVWHHGYLVLAWLTALWISFDPARSNRLPLAGLVLFLFVQCPWTWKAVRYERENAYSGSRAMARLLQTKLTGSSKVFGIGFSTAAVQPYFPSNIYANYSGGDAHKAFWTWSKENNPNDAVERLGTEHPDLVVIGYASETDRNLWTDLITRSGYHQVSETDGNLFWRSEKFQPENFRLFAPGPHVSDALLASSLRLNQSGGDVQLLSGITGSSTPEGRRLAPSGGVALQRPALSSGQSGARFEMDFEVSKEQFTRTGPMNLTVYVGGYRMHRMKISSAGQYRYQANTTARELFWAVVPIGFQFERVGLFAPALTEEAVAAVREIGLFTR